MASNSNSHEPECVAGLSWIDDRISQVAIRDGDRFSDTAFAHEIYHHALSDRTGDADAWHEGPGWGRYTGAGYERGEVDDARDALAFAGL